MTPVVTPTGCPIPSHRGALHAHCSAACPTTAARAHTGASSFPDGWRSATPTALETYTAGDAYYMAPGHLPPIRSTGAEVVEFSPTVRAARDDGGHRRQHGGGGVVSAPTTAAAGAARTDELAADRHPLPGDRRGRAGPVRTGRVLRLHDADLADCRPRALAAVLALRSAGHPWPGRVSRHRLDRHRRGASSWSSRRSWVDGDGETLVLPRDAPRRRRRRPGSSTCPCTAPATGTPARVAEHAAAVDADPAVGRRPPGPTAVRSGRGRHGGGGAPGHRPTTSDAARVRAYDRAKAAGDTEGMAAAALALAAHPFVRHRARPRPRLPVRGLRAGRGDPCGPGWPSRWRGHGPTAGIPTGQPGSPRRPRKAPSGWATAGCSPTRSTPSSSRTGAPTSSRTACGSPPAWRTPRRT